MNSLKLALAAAALAAPAAARPDPDAALGKLIAGRVAGEPTPCISLSPTRPAQIIQGRAIVYRVGGTLYVNRPTSGAEALDEDDLLVTRSFGGQLCRLDIVRLLSRGSRLPRGSVTLGDFVPYAKPKAA